MKNLLPLLLTILVALQGVAAPAPLGKDKLKMYKAANLYAGGDYYGALKVYKEIYSADKENQQDPELLFLMGRCHFMMKEYKEAVEFLEGAKKYEGTKPNDEGYEYLTISYQKLGDADNAYLTAAALYRLIDADKVKGTEAEKLYLNAQFAKKTMAKPVNVSFNNLGAKINSDTDESNPCLSADGKTFVFTSRRSDTEGGKVDENDGKFYQDIYIAEWDSVANTWGEGQHIDGSLNGKSHDASCSISPDGSMIFIYRNMVNKGSGQIFFSKKNKNGAWGTPKEVEEGVNTSFFETSGCVSADGKWFYFVSERTGGGAKGNADIWRAPKIGKNLYGKAENLGEVINTEGDEVSVYIHPDNKTIYFASNGHYANNMGGYDIFKSTVDKSGKWSKPENLGYPVNTVADERQFILSTDGKKAYFTSPRAGGQGALDIWEIDMTLYGQDASVPAAYSGPPLSILKGQVVNADGGAVVTKINVKDDTGTVINTIDTDEGGYYFITLEAEKDYTIEITEGVVTPVTEKVNLPKAKTGTFTQYKLLKVEVKK